MSISRIQFKKIALYFFSLLIIFALLIITINSAPFDEELHPEVKLAMQVPPQIDPQQNAYFALFGMEAAADKDMQQVGIQLTARYLQNREKRENDELSPADMNEIAGGKDLDEVWSKQYNRCNSRQVNDCLTKMQAQIKNKPMADPRFTVMLQRYQKIMTMQQYQDLQNGSPGTPLPRFGHSLDIAKIYLAQLSTERDPMVFLTAVQKDMKFWRMVLNQSNSLIGKMIATAALWNDLQYLSGYMQNKTFTAQQQSLITQLLVTLNKDELDISKSFLEENRTTAFVFIEMEKNWQSRMFFQYNASLNAQYFFYTKPNIELAKLSSTKLAEFMSLDQKNEPSRFTWSPSSLYNPIGKILLSVSAPSMQTYIARVHDLNGLILLLQLQLSLKDSPVETIENSIKNSPIKNPYTDQPMQWNKSEGTLQFKCLDVKSICQVKI